MSASPSAETGIRRFARRRPLTLFLALAIALRGKTSREERARLDAANGEGATA